MTLLFRIDNSFCMQDSDSSYNKHGLLFLIGTTVLSLLFIGYISFQQNEIDLEEQTQAVSSSEGSDSRDWISSDSLIQKGQGIYKAQCALCHGPKGLGDGNPGLVPPPRNLVEGKWKMGEGSAERLFQTLFEGIPNSSMVSFKHLPKIDRWALVHYIRSITKNKVKDDPKKLEEFAKKAI